MFECQKAKTFRSKQNLRKVDEFKKQFFERNSIRIAEKHHKS